VFSLSPTFVEVKPARNAKLAVTGASGRGRGFLRAFAGPTKDAYSGKQWTLCGNESLAEELAQDTLFERGKCLHRYNCRCQFLHLVVLYFV